MHFRRHLLWGFLSLGFVALSGLAINSVLLSKTKEVGLGLFSQAYAIYVVVSQFSILGIHSSLLRTVAIEREHSVRLSHLLSALLAAAPLSLACGTLVWFFR